MQVTDRLQAKGARPRAGSPRTSRVAARASRWPATARSAEKTQAPRGEPPGAWTFGRLRRPHLDRDYFDSPGITVLTADSTASLACSNRSFAWPMTEVAVFSALSWTFVTTVSACFAVAAACFFAAFTVWAICFSAFATAFWACGGNFLTAFFTAARAWRGAFFTAARTAA